MTGTQPNGKSKKSCDRMALAPVIIFVASPVPAR
jgi:hypothetical protein